MAAGEFVLPDAMGMLRELREIIAHLDVTDCLFRCNHASNYLPIGGRLPADKAAILASLDKVLDAPAATPAAGELAAALAAARAAAALRRGPRADGVRDPADATRSRA